MSDREFVYKFLYRNYILEMGVSDILFKDIDENELKYDIKSFNIHLRKILGEIPYLSRFIDEWYTENSTKILTELFGFFNKLDLSEKSVKCLEKIKKYCAETQHYEYQFANRRFEEYYLKRYELEHLKELTDKINLEHHSSNNMMDLIFIDDETPSIYEKIRNMLNEWYFQNVMDKKLATFIDRSEVILGKTNWCIKNLDYGTTTIDEVMNFFSGENPYQKVMIKNILERWFEEQQIIVSERAMKNIWY
jgi:hypothetical protein